MFALLDTLASSQALPSSFSNLFAILNNPLLVLSAPNTYVARLAHLVPHLANLALVPAMFAHHSTTVNASDATHTGSCSMALERASQLPYLCHRILSLNVQSLACSIASLANI